MRHRVLLTGASGSGKSEAIIWLAVAYPTRKFIAFDFQDGIPPLLIARGETPPNLSIVTVESSDIEEAWLALRKAYDEARAACGPGDWICTDLAEIPWEMTQQFYARRKYGMELADYLLQQVVQATKKTGFKALETDDWTLGIRPQYYMTLPRTLGAGCKANVLVTASLKDVASWMKDGELRYLEPKLPAQYKKAGVKPAGESGLTGQVDVVIQLEHPTEKAWRMRTLGKSRYGEFGWVDITDKLWFEGYLDKLGLEE